MERKKRIQSEETKEKIRQAQTGKKHSEVTKEKIRAKNKGKVLTNESKEKISQGLKNYWSNVTWIDDNENNDLKSECENE